MDLSGGLRANAIKNMGNIGTHDALLALLELAANEKLNAGERKLALKQAERIIK
jgi:HEAT repeat protein